MDVEQSFTTEERAQRINAAWQKSIGGILDTGRELIAARKGLKHGEWQAMFDRGLIRFSRETAFRLMKIASNPVLSNVAHEQRLPQSWATLYELSRFRPDVLELYMARGVIGPDTQRIDVLTLGLEAPLRRPKKPNRRGRPQLSPGQELEFQEKFSQVVRDQVQTLANVLSQPLTFDDDGRINTGVCWVPPFDIPASVRVQPKKPKALHRCECGHVHEDQRHLSGKREGNGRG
jgi:hypothetical protein